MTILANHGEEYLPHPYADYFPMMTGEEFASLVEDIKRAGLREKIWLFQGKILDGRNRYKACLETGTYPQFRQFTGTEEDALAAVLSWNLERRHLNSGQRAMVALEILPELERLAREKQLATLSRNAEYGSLGGRGNKKPFEVNLPQRVSPSEQAPTRQPQARDKAAQVVSVSPSSVQTAKKIATARPDLAEKVRAGEITLNRAKATVKQEEREQALAKQVSQSSVFTPQIVCQDAIAWLETVEPFDLLLTDPPYSTDVEDIEGFARSWLPLALSKMKPTGRAYVCVGAYPKELNAYLSVAMPDQVLVWTYRNTLGPSPKDNYKLNWQAILYYKGSEAPPLDCPIMLEQFSVQDIAAPDGRQGDRYHSWQKPLELGERFVRHSTKAGQSVVDPFACTGTFLIAACKLGRFGIGCDISRDNLKIAEERGCQVSPKI